MVDAKQRLLTRLELYLSSSRILQSYRSLALLLKLLDIMSMLRTITTTHISHYQYATFLFISNKNSLFSRFPNLENADTSPPRIFCMFLTLPSVKMGVFTVRAIPSNYDICRLTTIIFYLNADRVACHPKFQMLYLL